MRRAVAIVIDGIAAAGPTIARDVAAICGVGLVSYGAWLAYPPVGFIVLGVMVLLAAIFNARRAD